MAHAWKIAGILLLFLVARVTFGLCYSFWNDDELQVFLLGFKYYATGLWPYFGPDVVYRGGQIPGALQSLLIGLPLAWIPKLEAPYILLNVLSMVGLTVLYMYIQKKIPSMPWWTILFWLMLAPWTVHFGTHIVNPSYVLFGACLFFVAFLEIVPVTTTGWWNKRLSFYLLGFALFWIFQLHMSYVVLVPFIGYVFYIQKGESWKSMLALAGIFVLGCITTASFVIPTFISHGIGAKGMGGSTNNIVFMPANLQETGNLILRLFSFGSFEFNRFIGLKTEEKLAVMGRHPWAAPSIVLVALVGFAQVGLMLAQFYFKKEKEKAFGFLKMTLIATIVFLAASFMFSAKEPASHTIYLLLPLVMVFYFFSLEKIMRFGWVKPMLVAFYISAMAFHVVIAMEKREKESFIVQLPKVQEAFKCRDYKVLGLRRSDISGCCY